MNQTEFSEKLAEIREYALDDFADEIADNLRKNIKEMWYDTYVPEDYERTYELLNSIDIKETKAGRQVYINEATIFNGNRQGISGWTEHIGVSGERVDSFADMISENAQGNPKGGNKRAILQGGADTNFYEATNEWVERNIAPRVLDLVVRELGKNSIRAKVTTGNVANIKGNWQQGYRLKI